MTKEPYLNMGLPPGIRGCCPDCGLRFKKDKLLHEIIEDERSRLLAEIKKEIQALIVIRQEEAKVTISMNLSDAIKDEIKGLEDALGVINRIGGKNT